MAKITQQLYLKNAIVEWMKSNKPLPLEVLLERSTLSVGAIFTHHSNFFFSGLSKVAAARKEGRSTKPASGYSKIVEAKIRLSFNFHDEHLTSNSSWIELSGQKRAFILGVITDIKNDVIQCIPYVIANIIDPADALFGFSGQWHNHLEIYVSQIASFFMTDVPPPRLPKSSLDRLKGVSELEIKHAFADIVGEPSVPKDWGGETSDLQSGMVILNGRRISAAFLFKGPSKFRPMTPADLGKNGDQIGRLFDEPAELLVLQHCHEVTSSVRKQMRAYANQMGNPRRFCIIDGYDTIRVLATHKKCGF